MVRRSERVHFPGGAGFPLQGILDLPDHSPKAVAVFTHCFTCSKDLKVIVRLSRGLAECGFSVLRYDLTGLGSSQGEFSKTSFTTNRADLRAAIAYLTQHGEAPSFLIGHSFGGACSLAVAQESASVRAVVSIASPSDTHHLADYLHRLNPQITDSGLGSVSIGGREYDIRKPMLDDFRSFDLPATLRQLSKPTLLFHSPEDQTLGFEHVLRLYSLLTQRAADDAEPAAASLICVPHADHLFSSNPADLDMLIAMTAAWFDRQLR